MKHVRKALARFQRYFLLAHLLVLFAGIAAIGVATSFHKDHDAHAMMAVSYADQVHALRRFKEALQDVPVDRRARLLRDTYRVSTPAELDDLLLSAVGKARDHASWILAHRQRVAYAEGYLAAAPWLLAALLLLVLSSFIRFHDQALSERPSA